MKFLITESRLKEALTNLIEDGDLEGAIDAVGGLKNLIKILPDLDLRKYLIPKIKSILEDIGGVSPTEIGLENIDLGIRENWEGDKEYHQVEYFGINGPIVQIWGGIDFGTDYGEYRISYNGLDDLDIYDIYVYLKKYYNGLD